jgi:outer membrane immunogenic protein
LEDRIMKIALAAAAVAAVAFASPALAADAPQINWYGNVGYANVDASGGPALDTVNVRVGGRSTHFGIEGEASVGLGDKNDSGAKVKVQDEYAAYAVGFLPVSPNADVFARIGYGRTDIKASAGGFSATAGEDSVNYGVGGQYMWGANGVRADYTYLNFQNGGGHANAWGLSFVRKF